MIYSFAAAYLSGAVVFIHIISIIMPAPADSYSNKQQHLRKEPFS